MKSIVSKAPGYRSPVLVLALLFLSVNTVVAQTTEFTYQGKLVDGGTAANASYDFEFRLFATDTGGSAIATQTRASVVVANGIFTVSLDFGGQFDGNPRWLEIALKPAGSANPLSVLAPRQPITSTPYSVRSLSAARADVATNSLQLGGVNANQYVLTTDARLTDARPPLPNSSNYIQNSAAQQSSSNFNISGNGAVGGNLTVGGSLSLNIVNAQTQFNLGGSRILSNTGNANLFAGIGAGQANTIGASNAFFGNSAGASNTSGNQNSLYGFFAGISNTTGNRSSYFGYRAGQQGSTNNDNSFFGYRAGNANTANNNSFFGASAGDINTTGENNSFFGASAGPANTSGHDNAFFGYHAGLANTSGEFNAFFGADVGSGNTTGFGNSFFGNVTGDSNTTGGDNSFFGHRAGTANISGENNAFFGAVTGRSNTIGSGNSFFGSAAGNDNIEGDYNSFFGDGAGLSNKTGAKNTIIGAQADVTSTNLSYATAIGAGAVVSANNTIVLGRSAGQDDVRVPGNLVVVQLGSAGSTSLCRNASNFIASCSSSLRYKTDVQPFNGGLNLVNRLRPISFSWRNGGMRDVGFGAEDVEKVEPLLVSYNDKGEIEGVKYAQLTTVLVNALKEQQAQIEAQQTQIRERERQAAIQQTQIEQYRKQAALQQERINLQQAQLTGQHSETEALKQLICRSHRQAAVCQARRKR